MKMKNAEVEPFIEFLMNFELKGRDSRMRTRFVRMLMERQKLITDEHQDLIKQYAKFNEDGTPVVIERNGVKMYDVKNKSEFQKEYALLLNEDFVIDETEERKDVLLFVKDLILDCDMTFSGKEALEYDRWCEIAEEINYNN